MAGVKGSTKSKGWKVLMSRIMKEKGIRPPSRKGEKSPSLLNEKHHQWKGENASRSAIHYWVQRRLGRPKKCDMCHTTSKRWYDWANVDHEYRRDLNDWLRLCRSCHRKHDNAMRLAI